MIVWKIDAEVIVISVIHATLKNLSKGEIIHGWLQGVLWFFEMFLKFQCTQNKTKPIPYAIEAYERRNWKIACISSNIAPVMRLTFFSFDAMLQIYYKFFF